MKIFISYARVDKPYCMQIVNTLDVHDVWYDQRLYAGQQWWKEILRRLDWCEGFIYLLSPDSVNSEYCWREFELAESLGRQVIPILIVPNTQIPPRLADLQYIDLTGGLSVENVTELLNSIYVADQRNKTTTNIPFSNIRSEQIQPPVITNSKIVGQAAAAMENGQFDQAVYLLRQAKEAGFQSQFIKIDDLLRVAESALERQTYLREAEREYRQISDLVRHQFTREWGCKAFQDFRVAYPEYDPDGIATVCGIVSNKLASPISVDDVTTTEKNLTALNGFHESEHSSDLITEIPSQVVYQTSTQEMIPTPQDIGVSLITTSVPVVIPRPPSTTSVISPQTQTKVNIAVTFSLPLLEFIEIPAGVVHIDAFADSSPNVERSGHYVKAFRMTKYPITNRQYQMFVQDSEGYANEVWWRFSPQAVNWRKENPKPKPSQFKGDERPREMVNWYDAMAFAGWLGYRLGRRITLPTVAQYQRGAQGNDNRVFPWGMEFDKGYCNTRESGMKMTTPVNQYDKGVSPYGIYDLAGNVWEWCLDMVEESDESSEGRLVRKRAVIGGSFVSPYERSQITFNYYLNPQTLYASIGFRVIESIE